VHRLETVSAVLGTNWRIERWALGFTSLYVDQAAEWKFVPGDAATGIRTPSEAFAKT